MSLEEYAEFQAKRGHPPPEEPDHSSIERARFWDIDPVPAPRQVARDKFNPSPAVSRYRAFGDECALRNIWHPRPGDVVIFLLRIPPSRMRDGLDGMPYEQVPDTDNLMKALLDACYGNDALIWGIHAYKLWSSTPGIYIERHEPELALPWQVPGHLLP